MAKLDRNLRQGPRIKPIQPFNFRYVHVGRARPWMPEKRKPAMPELARGPDLLYLVLRRTAPAVDSGDNEHECDTLCVLIIWNAGAGGQIRISLRL